MADKRDLLLSDEEDYDNYKDRYQGDWEDRKVSSRLMIGLFMVCALSLVVPFLLNAFNVISRSVMTLCFIPSILVLVGILVACRK